MSVPTDPLSVDALSVPAHPLMDESINLDDDTILSPQSDDNTQSSHLAQLDAPEPPAEEVTDLPPADAAGEDPDVETARIMAEAKSMENILLETSPTLELGSDSVLTASSMISGSSVTSEEISTASEVAPLPEASATVNQGEDDSTPEAAGVKPPEEPVAEPISSPQESTPQLSSYFPSTIEYVKDDSSFFDSIPGENTTFSVDEETETGVTPLVPGDHVSNPDILPHEEVRIRERTISMASEEATPVSFEEDKGVGLKYVGSMDSVRKFFSESSGVDAEGKAFFDSFTAGASDIIEEQPGNVSPSEVESLAGPVSATPPVSIPGSAPNSLPPETPPIPHEPMSMSPLPSPIHTSFMRQRSISQSQASPVPSPIHSTTHSTSEAPGNKETTPLETPESAPGLQNTFPSGDDLFTSGLSMSDADRRHDAWIPSELTRQAIVSMVTSAPGTYALEPEQLTTPGITINDPFGDPVKELLQRFLGDVEANKRITLTIEDVTANIEGLRKLISAECWRSAADLSGKLLEELGQGVGKVDEVTGHTSESLEVWFCRIALLVKMRLYSNAEAECQAFGNLDKPDLYYEYYPDLHPGRRGSMVPFSFRILHAELPQFLGKTQESLDRLYYVQAITKKILANLECGLAEDGSMLQLSDEGRKASVDLWTRREVQLLYAIGNCLLANKDYGMAIEVFEQLVKMDEAVNKDDLHCCIGRIYLQMGDIKAAQRLFSLAETSSDATNPEIKCRNLMNKGFIALGQDLFAEAHNYFKQATMISPTNAVAVNNMAVCSLYMGQLKEALNTLEQLVHKDPARYLQEGILFNLCTLYELESSRPQHKKQALLQLVSKHKGNGFNVACLKMT